MHDCGQAFLRVINDILDYSKLDAGKLQLESVDFTVESQLKSLTDLLRAHLTDFADRSGGAGRNAFTPSLPHALTSSATEELSRALRARKYCSYGRLPATREIRRSERGAKKRLPIVARTADAQIEGQTACPASGMEDYVSQPTSLARLRAVLDRGLPEPVVARPTAPMA